jgi:hypothetical protein
MRVIMPSPGTGLPQILDAIRRALIPAISQDEAAPRVLLQSPDGTVYSVTVDNAGSLKTVKVDGKTRA